MVGGGPCPSPPCSVSGRVVSTLRLPVLPAQVTEGKQGIAAKRYVH